MRSVEVQCVPSRSIEVRCAEVPHVRGVFALYRRSARPVSVRAMDHSHRHRLRESSIGKGDGFRGTAAGPRARATPHVVLTLLAAMAITALSAVHADATIASRTTVKRKNPKPTATSRSTVATTTTLAAATLPKAASASKTGACDLVTAAEAAVVVGTPGLVADTPSSATACSYRRDGIGNPRVLVSVRPFEDKELFVQSRSSAGASSRAIPLAGLGDVAYRSADWSQIEFLKGKAAVLIVMNVIDANGTFSGPDQSKALDAARVAATRA